MKKIAIPESVIPVILKAQKNEITEYHIYTRLADSIRDKHNSDVLRKIGNDEKAHYEYWKNFTGTDVKPRRFRIFRFYWISKIFGLTFGIKLMERGEAEAQINYDMLSEYVKDAKKIAHEEDAHEKQLIALIEEERLDYVGSVVLGLNDALVELTGALAGFTFAMQNTKLIALAGLITGIAASFSMAASEYLSQRSEIAGKEEEEDTALKSAVYTGITYVTTVILLILPYLLVNNFMICLAMTLTIAIIIIFFFNYYISVAKDLNFKTRFFEMAFISLGVSAITFLIGVLIRQFINIQI